METSFPDQDDILCTIAMGNSQEKRVAWWDLAELVTTLKKDRPDLQTVDLKSLHAAVFNVWQAMAQDGLLDVACRLTPKGIRQYLTKHGFQPLSTLYPEWGSPPPSWLWLPDGTDVSFRKGPGGWKDLCVEVVKWLSSSGKLSPDICPIKRPRSRFRYLVNTAPYHGNDDDFSQAAPVGQMWVETKFDCRKIVDNTRFIIQAAGEDPSQFLVTWP